jgi:sarcosine oxidase
LFLKAFRSILSCLRSSDPDLLVLGGGAIGLATAWAAAGRGARVLVLEQFTSPNARSSHHGDTRMIRCAYFEHPDYVALALRAWAMWEQWDREQGGAPALHATGGLYFGAPDSELIAGARGAAERHDLPHRTLDAQAAAAAFPQFRLPAGTLALHESRAGFVRCEDAMRRLTAQARAAGVEIREGVTVTRAEAEANGDCCAMLADGTRVRARAIADARGPGMAAAGLPWPLRVTRQLLGWFAPVQSAPLAEGRMPVWACTAQTAGESGDGLFYGFPLLAGDGGVKAARHFPGAEILPYSQEPAETGELADVARALARVLPDAAGPTARATACQYTMSPDGHFILDRHPLGWNGAAIAGLSGHGFKFAPVLGQALAELALDGGTALPVGFLSARRFGQRPT